MVTLPDAESRLQKYLAGSSARSITSSRTLAESLLGPKAPFWSDTIPRTREGFFHYKAGLSAAIKRCLAYAP